MTNPVSSSDALLDKTRFTQFVRYRLQTTVMEQLCYYRTRSF